MVTTGRSQRFYDPSSIGLTVSTFSDSDDEVLCLCPFHDDKTPSASFNVIKGLFYCFKCDLSFTAKRLAEELGGTIDFVSFSEKTRHFSSYNYDEWMGFFSAPLAFNNEYLQTRGVSDDQIEKFDIRFVQDRVVFLSRDISNMPNGVILRRIDGGHPRYQKLGSIPVWPMNCIPSTRKTLLLVEGPFGVIRSSMAGYLSFALLKASPAREMIKLLNGFDTLAFLDNDLPGQIGSIKLFKHLHSKIVYPGGEVDELSPQKIRQVIRKRASHNIAKLIEILREAGKDGLLIKLGL